MKIVCGQSQPHQTRPMATVESASITSTQSAMSTTRWKSCGQNTMPRNTKRRSSTFSRTSGCPRNFTNGASTRNASRNQLTIVRAR